MASKRKNETDEESQYEAQVQAAKRFFATSSYSDLVIKCRGQEWKVHKFMVCGQSEYFHKQCSGEFKEAKENLIELKEDEPEVVEAMLYYMYHGTYESTETGNTMPDLPPILLDVKMFSIADKYFLPHLKSLVRTQFLQRCDGSWASDEFVLAVREIYAQDLPDKSLKDIAVRIVKNHATQYLTRVDQYKDINEAIRDIPALGADILQELAAVRYNFGTGKEAIDSQKKNLNTFTFKCGICGHVFTESTPKKAPSNISCPQLCNMYQRSDWAYWKDQII